MYLGTIQEAADRIEAAGFAKGFIRDELHEQAQQQPARFYIEEGHHVGEDRLHFALRFTIEHDLVSMQECTASLLHVPLAHGLINQIDTAKLDQDMAAVNWLVDYPAASRSLHQETRAFIFAIGKDLEQLRHGTDPQGAELAEKLAVKYWSWTPINDYNSYWDEARKPYLATKNYDLLPTVEQAYRELGQAQQLIHIKKIEHMNEQNLDFLASSVKYLGFEDKTAAVMDTKIRQQVPEFQVTAQHDHFNNSVFHTLHFKKSSESDMYFFNKYDATLSNGKPEEDKTQTFYIKNGQGFTAKEAYNLLEGRAVYKELKNKEGQPYTAWSKLELDKEKDKNNNYPVRQFTGGWGYDLEKSVSRFPVQELNDPEQKAALLKSLQKGNQQRVTIDKDGKPEKFYFEAVPNLRTVNIYDTRRKEIKRETLLKPELKVKKEKKEDQSEEQKQGRKKSRGKGI